MEGDAETHGLAAGSLPMTARPPRASRPNLRHVWALSRAPPSLALLASRAGTWRGDRKRTAGPACPQGTRPEGRAKGRRWRS